MQRIRLRKILLLLKSDIKSNGTTRTRFVESYSAPFDCTREKNYSSFEKIHLFNEGYSLYSAFGVAELEEAERARAKEKEWFYEIAPNLTWNLSDFKVRILGNVAIATLTVIYSPINSSQNSRHLPTRGTVVLLKQGGNWRILHEHYSTVEISCLIYNNEGKILVVDQ